jgi:hypothetical protein
MTRTIQDESLRLWEVYANPGDFGSPDRATMVFQCLTDPSRRARSLARERPRAEIEEEIGQMSARELIGLLDGAQDLK